jgi:hypothetical protein
MCMGVAKGNLRMRSRLLDQVPGHRLASPLSDDIRISRKEG